MTLTRICMAITIAVSLAGCFGPQDRRPGMRLPGEVTPTPSDWSFTDDHPEIAIEVRTPYFLPHSVTIACGSLDGNLFIGASDPETKHWPGWGSDRAHSPRHLYQVRPLSPAQRCGNTLLAGSAALVGRDQRALRTCDQAKRLIPHAGLRMKAIPIVRSEVGELWGER